MGHNGRTTLSRILFPISETSRVVTRTIDPPEGVAEGPAKVTVTIISDQIEDRSK